MNRNRPRVSRLTCDCGKPIHDNAAICGDCTDRLRVALDGLANLWPQMEVTITRQDSIGLGAGESDGMVFFNPEASAVKDVLTNTITTWARVVMDEVTPSWCPVPPRHVNLCGYMLELVPQIRNREWAPEILDELDDAAQLLARTVDRPADRRFVGPCDVCSEDLYVKPGKPTVTCRKCDLDYDVAARREWLLAKAEDRLGTATQIARAVTSLGTPITPDRVRQWAHRGRLVVKGHEGRRPLYRVGDVLTLAYDEPARRTREVVS